MSKQILVIGGGISGLSVLHNLKKKYASESGVEIRLLEKNDHVGGTARTVRYPLCLFEEGPNGFLDSKESTLQLAREIGLGGELLPAHHQAAIRYICLNNTLHKLPHSPVDIFKFKPLSLLDKLRLPFELIIPKGTDPNETVYGFGKRRIGENFSRIFLDPMVSGIFGGDAQAMHLRSAFPRIYEIEQIHGSLIRGMMKSAKAKKNGQPAGHLTSFSGGMSRLVEALYKRYQKSIHLSEDVLELHQIEDGFSVKTSKSQYAAREIYLCAPAYRAAKILEISAPKLAQALAAIVYAPMAVVGLVYQRQKLETFPEGFGYLIPSSEEKKVLGVLFSSNIFSERTAGDYFLFRVMIGGARHPDILNFSHDELYKMAREEITRTLKIKEAPAEQMLKVWPEAIPQYNIEYPGLKRTIEAEVGKIKGLRLVANYLNGISLNDCTANAATAVQQGA